MDPIKFRILFGKPEEKKQLGRRRIRWEDDIKIDLKEMVHWIYVASGREQWLARVNAVMNLGIAENIDSFFTIKGAISFWGISVLRELILYILVCKFHSWFTLWASFGSAMVKHTRDNFEVAYWHWKLLRAWLQSILI